MENFMIMLNEIEFYDDTAIVLFNGCTIYVWGKELDVRLSILHIDLMSWHSY